MSGLASANLPHICALSCLKVADVFGGDGGGKTNKKNKAALLRRKTVNTLHAATVLMCNKELTEKVRMIGFLARPAFGEYNMMCYTLKDGAATAKAYCDWASGSWLAALKKTFQCLADLGGMAPGGMQVSFGRSVLEG